MFLNVFLWFVWSVTAVNEKAALSTAFSFKDLVDTRIDFD
jgi:hypothetical protein